MILLSLNCVKCDLHSPSAFSRQCASLVLYLPTIQYNLSSTNHHIRNKTDQNVRGIAVSPEPPISKHKYNHHNFSNIVGDEDCLKPSLTDMKLEPETENHLDMHSAVRKSDKVSLAIRWYHRFHKDDIIPWSKVSNCSRRLY